MKFGTLLVAEDDFDDRILIRDALDRLPFQIDLRFVKDGKELISYLHQKGKGNASPKLILLDLNLPGMNGHTALKEIKANPDIAHIPVVVLTTSSSEYDIVNSFENGAKYYYRKPSSLLELTQILNHLVSHFM